MAGKVAEFLEEARAGPKKRPAEAPAEPSKHPRLLLPVTLHLDYGREAREVRTGRSA